LSSNFGESIGKIRSAFVSFRELLFLERRGVGLLTVDSVGGAHGWRKLWGWDHGCHDERRSSEPVFEN